MKSVLYLICLSSWATLFSQRAVTNDGKEMMLFEDKTWKPYRDSLGEFSTLEAFTAGDQKVMILSNRTWKFMNKETESLYENTHVNSKKLTVSSTASSLMQSKRVDAGFYYDPKEWSIIQEQHESSQEEYSLKGRLNPDLYASFGSFPIEDKAGLKNVKDIVLTHFLMNPSHYKIRTTEFRTVNGIEIFYIRYYDINLKYDIIQYYLITDDHYCAQISAGSPQKDFAINEKVLQDFLNGMVKIRTEKYIEKINAEAPVPPPPTFKN